MKMMLSDVIGHENQS